MYLSYKIVNCAYFYLITAIRAIIVSKLHKNKNQYKPLKLDELIQVCEIFNKQCNVYAVRYIIC